MRPTMHLAHGRKRKRVQKKTDWAVASFPLYYILEYEWDPARVLTGQKPIFVIVWNIR